MRRSRSRRGVGGFGCDRRGGGEFGCDRRGGGEFGCDRRGGGEFGCDTRGVAPAVGKALEVSIVVLFVGLLATSLYGGVVPDYRTAIGERVADRTLADVADRIEGTTPPEARTARIVIGIDLPDTIRGRPYAVRAQSRTLVLDHPHPSVGGATPLALPPHVDAVTGTWHSDRPSRLVVEGTADGYDLRLEVSS